MPNGIIRHFIVSIEAGEVSDTNWNHTRLEMVNTSPGETKSDFLLYVEAPQLSEQTAIEY